MAKKNSIKERAKRVPKKIKDKVKRSAKRAREKFSPIKREISFTGSLAEHKDGSLYLFVDIQSPDGNISKGLPLTKAEVRGIQKFVEFLDLG